MNIRTSSRFAFVLGALAAALIGSIPARAAFVIDDFASPITPDALVGAFGSTDTRSDFLIVPPLPYNIRNTTVTSTLTGVISATVGGGQLIDISVLNTGGQVHLAYFAPAGGPIDFLSGGATHFAFDLLSSANNGALNVTLVANGTSSTGAVAIPASATPSTFLVPIPATPDFAAASFFDVFVDLSGGATSVSIDRFSTTVAAVPEPTTAIVWALVLISTIGSMGVRRDTIA